MRYVLLRSLRKYRRMAQGMDQAIVTYVARNTDERIVDLVRDAAVLKGCESIFFGLNKSSMTYIHAFVKIRWFNIG